MAFLVLSYLPENFTTSFSLTAERSSIVCTTFHCLLSAEGHLGRFHFLAIVNKATIDGRASVYRWDGQPLSIYQGMVELGHVI